VAHHVGLDQLAVLLVVRHRMRARPDDGWAHLPYTEWYPNSILFPDSEAARHHAAVHGGKPYAAFRADFDRAAEAFDAGAWADLFAEAGARYAVFVTKHHDGYCLWPTDVPNPHRPGWHSARDFVGELAAASPSAPIIQAGSTGPSATSPSPRSAI
jgi:alpha-L-fucosidase